MPQPLIGLAGESDLYSFQCCVPHSASSATRLPQAPHPAPSCTEWGIPLFLVRFFPFTPELEETEPTTPRHFVNHSKRLNISW